ncbi:chromate efflux transporter [Halomonas sp. HP20-15]|uniref:chromate efflux transporter n=1 Tax=Halomonas sp. HP20-15 TaxID=3085901 RepID=UPI002980C932|nr:chromate efflux transporter [Halomonas sp. HP20-15]MDW5378377.1 chromate efflux transporter [Halomonas sp. HP20-15]
MPLAIFLDFLKLGCVSFGGPIAHLGYFHRRYVIERATLDERDYAELLALCQFLPGPASSQMSMAIGYRQHGVTGSLAAFAGFTLPSALLMLGAGLWLTGAPDNAWVAGALSGLKLLAVAVVADAVLTLQARCCPDTPRRVLALLTSIAVWLMPGTATQVAALLGAALLGSLMGDAERAAGATRPAVTRPHRWAWIAFALLWLAVWLVPGLAVFDTFYRVGSLVFGGGHVVLPLLGAEPLIRTGMDEATFIAGYSLAQAVPGPMFTLAGYLGSALNGSLLDGLVALTAIFLPGWLLLLAVLPLWSRLRGRPRLANAMAWVTAATVGLLLAALYDPVFRSSVADPADMAAVAALWSLLKYTPLPVWAVVLVAGLGGALWG